MLRKREVTAFGAAVLTLATVVYASPGGFGEIVRSENATINGVAVPEQGMVSPDATLSTGTGGSALVQFSLDSQVNLLDGTSVTFRSGGGRLAAEMSSGTVGARSLGKDPLVVDTPGYHIEPAATGKAIYVVAMLLDKTTIVSARQGSVAIVQKSSGEKYVLSKGHYAKIAEAPQAVPPQQQSDQNGPGGAPPALLASPGKLFIIAIGAGVGIAVLLDKTVDACGKGCENGNEAVGVLATPTASPSAP